MTKQGWIKRKANGNGTPWNKGRNDLPKHTEEHKRKIGLAGIGNTHGFKKGVPSFNKGLPTPWTTGENHWDWKGGITPEHHLARKSQEYAEWRTAVYMRDRWTCQDCGIKCQKGNIVAHHLISFTDREDLRYVVSNGQVLCRPCHARVHQEERDLARSIARARVISQTTVA